MSFAAVISAGGRYVAFHSDATNLDPADIDATTDVFRRDRRTGITTLVSRATGAGGPKANDPGSFGPSISADGRLVAFESYATNLDPADTDGMLDVFARDVVAGTTTLASRAPGAAGAKAGGVSYKASVSGDASHVAFLSTATNLDPGDADATTDVYLRGLGSASTTLVSRGPGVSGPKSNAICGFASVSADGRFVAFQSDATNLDPADADSTTDVFLRDVTAGTTTLMSRATGPSGAKGNFGGILPAVSADGDSVAFTTGSTNFDPVDVDDAVDVYVRDVTAATTTMVTRAIGAAGEKGNAPFALDPVLAAVSADGRYVAFNNISTNLVRTLALPGVTGGTWFVNGGLTLNYGTTGDIAVPADYDGDARTDVSVFRPSTATWFARNSGTGTDTIVTFGIGGDIPLPLPNAIARNL